MYRIVDAAYDGGFEFGGFALPARQLTLIVLSPPKCTVFGYVAKLPIAGKTKSPRYCTFIEDSPIFAHTTRR